MEKEELDYVLLPLGLLPLVVYHLWLLQTILNHPTRTVIGLNAESRQQWVFSIMTDPLKNGTLAVQTIRNNIMASTLLATTAIALSSFISVYVSSSGNTNDAASQLIYGNKTPLMSSIKHFSMLLCFLIAFLCNVQAVRYYAHVSFLITLATSQDKEDAIEYVARNLNGASVFWSLGLRAFYLSFPLFLWTFGPIPMVICCYVMTVVLYFLDTTTRSCMRKLRTHSSVLREDMMKVDDVESSGPSLDDTWFQDTVDCGPLLAETKT